MKSFTVGVPLLLVICLAKDVSGNPRPQPHVIRRGHHSAAHLGREQRYLYDRARALAVAGRAQAAAIRAAAARAAATQVWVARATAASRQARRGGARNVNPWSLIQGSAGRFTVAHARRTPHRGRVGVSVRGRGRHGVWPWHYATTGRSGAGAGRGGVWVGVGSGLRPGSGSFRRGWPGSFSGGRGVMVTAGRGAAGSAVGTGVFRHGGSQHGRTCNHGGRRAHSDPGFSWPWLPRKDSDESDESEGGSDDAGGVTTEAAESGFLWPTDEPEQEAEDDASTGISIPNFNWPWMPLDPEPDSTESGVEARNAGRDSIGTGVSSETDEDPDVQVEEATESEYPELDVFDDFPNSIEWGDNEAPEDDQGDYEVEQEPTEITISTKSIQTPSPTDYDSTEFAYSTQSPRVTEPTPGVTLPEATVVEESDGVGPEYRTVVEPTEPTRGVAVDAPVTEAAEKEGDCVEGAILVNGECACRDPEMFMDTILGKCTDLQVVIY